MGEFVSKESGLVRTSTHGKVQIFVEDRMCSMALSFWNRTHRRSLHSRFKNLSIL